MGGKISSLSRVSTLLTLFWLIDDSFGNVTNFGATLNLNKKKIKEFNRYFSQLNSNKLKTKKNH